MLSGGFRGGRKGSREDNAAADTDTDENKKPTLSIADVVHSARSRRMDAKVRALNERLVLLALPGIALMVLGLHLPGGRTRLLLEALNALSTALLLCCLLAYYRLQVKLQRSVTILRSKKDANALGGHVAFPKTETTQQRLHLFLGPLLLRADTMQ